MTSSDLAQPILRTEAIVLRVTPFSRTSHVVTWLSPEFGRVATVVKGACRPTSAFLGQYDLFATCELLFYRRDHDGLHAIRECSPLAPRHDLRADWRRITTAGYLCDLVARVCQPGQESASLVRLLAGTLDDLGRSPATAERILRFELALLRELGLQPSLDLCHACHPPATPWLRFALGAGRVRCAHTPHAAAPEPAVTVHRDVLRLLRQLADPADGSGPDTPPPLPDGLPPPGREPPPGAPAPRNLSADQLWLGSRRFLGIFMRFHLDTPPVPRRLAFELLQTLPTAVGNAQGETR